ncbi:hypothetical protein [Sulfitobacter pacificus]|uniref:hypothetical protein n=1 Tax=Sulfitobacter pacificus TaxID=1499314 RepID=UPI0031026041
MTDTTNLSASDWINLASLVAGIYGKTEGAAVLEKSGIMDAVGMKPGPVKSITPANGVMDDADKDILRYIARPKARQEKIRTADVQAYFDLQYDEALRRVNRLIAFSLIAPSPQSKKHYILTTGGEWAIREIEAGKPVFLD